MVKYFAGQTKSLLFGYKTRRGIMTRLNQQVVGRYQDPHIREGLEFSHCGASIDTTDKDPRDSRKILRANLRKILKSLSLQQIQEESQKIEDILLNLPVYKEADSVGVYINTEREVSTRGLIRDILYSGKKCYIPVLIEENFMKLARLRSQEELDSSKKNRWGINEIATYPGQEYAMEEEALELIIVPGLGYDVFKGRIGHGKGIYDRYLAECRKHCREKNWKNTIAIGLSLSPQLSQKRFPMESHDFILDMIITPDGVI